MRNRTFFALHLLAISLFALMTGCGLVDSNDSQEVGSIFVDSAPQGARIFLNEQNLFSTTPDTLVDVPAGSHRLTLVRPNYAERTTTVNVTRNQTETVFIDLRPLPGSITINSIPGGATVFLNGQNTNQTTPATLASVDPGQHSLTLMREEHLDTTITVTVVPNEGTEIEVELQVQRTGFPGKWRGTTGQDLPIFFQVLQGDIIDSFSVAVRLSFPFISRICEVELQPDTLVTIQNDAFRVFLEIPGSGIHTTLSGTLHSFYRATGAFDGYEGPFNITCNGASHSGSGRLFDAAAWRVKADNTKL